MSANLPDATELDATIARSLEELRLKQHANTLAWGLGKTDRWDADLDLGIIKFSNNDGFVVTANLQVIGTFYSVDQTWLWGWDHPSVDDRFAQAARQVRDFGERYGLARFTTSMVKCSEDEAWMFTALGLHLSGAAGAYRGPSGDSYVFMTFGEVTIRQIH
jgi:hypothetical protein